MRFLWRFNDYRIEGNVAHIALCNRAGAVVAEALIDLWDLDRVREAACWGVSVIKPGTVYVRGMMRGPGAPRGKKKPGMLLHRFILGAVDTGGRGRGGEFERGCSCTASSSALSTLG